jgi:NAD+ kinase
MKVAIYGRDFNDSVLPFVQEVFDALLAHKIEIKVHQKFFNFIERKIDLPDEIGVFSTHEELVRHADMLLSLGGDGTLLDTLTLIRNSQIPVIGINFGRLGFLASINKTEIQGAVKALVNKDYTIDKRSLLNIDSERSLFGDENFALNDITIHRRDNSAMMIIHAYMNGEFLNSYWADGLIIATPTGSTAYSLSCGGPIILPSSQNFVITPVAPHNLNVRPIIVPDDVQLTFEVEARSTKFLLTCDSRTETVDKSVKININKSKFSINLIRLNNETFLTTLRNKLLWGIDTRNY